MDITQINDYVCNNDYYPIENCKIRLTNNKLWDQFHDLQTEMIITKTGRRMFPSLNIHISNLDPEADYCVFLEMNVSQHCRFKYSASVGWSPAGHEEAQSPHRIYLHPESPSKGAHWMAQDVSFSRIKLTNNTNTCSPSQGQIVLSSMHRYQPRILIVKTSNTQALRWAPTQAVAFPETQFIAVTAYQNEKITKLKINYNPFAKGFRENGKSNLKRKQGERQEFVKKVAACVSSSEEDDSKRESTNNSILSIFPAYKYYYSSYPAYNHQWWAMPTPLYYQYSCEQDCSCLSGTRQLKKAKRIKDFSINAIMKH